MSQTCEFKFRIWAHPEDADPPEIEVWFHGLEPTKSGGIFVADWARESLSNEDLHDLFELDKTKHWQIVGTGTLRGWYDYFGEYDEEFDVVEFVKEEVPEAYFDSGLSITLDTST